jgi:probable rRNA maturation factor
MIMITNQTDHQIDIEKLRETASSFLQYYCQSKKNVSIALVDDQEITRLNRQFLNRDNVTDVMAFPGDKKDLGEVIVNYEQVRRQAQDECNSTEYELRFVLVHGLLHLLGWQDYTPEDKEIMLKEGERFLRLEVRDQS